MTKVEDVASGQFSASLAMCSNRNVKRKSHLFFSTSIGEEIQKDPKLRKLKDIDLKRSWMDRNLYWVASTATIIVLYGFYKALQTTQEKEVA